MPEKNQQKKRPGGSSLKFCIYCSQEYSSEQCPHTSRSGHDTLKVSFRRCGVCKSVIPVKGGCSFCAKQKQEHIELEAQKIEYTCRSCGSPRKGPGPCIPCQEVPEYDIAINSHDSKDGYYVTVHITRNAVFAGEVTYLYSIDGEKPVTRTTNEKGLDIIEVGWTNSSKKVTCSLVGTRSKSQEITLPKKKKPLSGFFSTSDPKEMWKAFFGKN